MIELITTPGCTKCSLVKTKLRDKKVNFREIMLESAEEIETFINKTGLRTVPQIMENDEIITAQYI